jgi:hypothetical protein
MAKVRSLAVRLTLAVVVAASGPGAAQDGGGVLEPAARALLAAAARGDAASLAVRAASGARVDVRDAEGRPALLLAARSGQGDAVRVLLAHGADPDAADRGGWTALHEAAGAGSTAMLDLLFEAGAFPDPPSRARGTPLDVAERASRDGAARLLRARGARGSGKSIGDTVCVRPWRGQGFCAVVEDVDPTRHLLRVTSIVGCAGGCRPDPVCSLDRPVGGPDGLSPGERLRVPTSCLTHVGVAPGR